MSEIPKPEQLSRVAEQPPMSWYFDPKVLEVEQRLLFGQGPNYVGHELLAPNPRGTEACTNVVEFYYLEDIALFEREYVEAEQKAYKETAVEDDIICLRMHQGRKSLYQRGIEEHGPYQSPTEDGMRHFHEYLRRNLASHL